MKGIKLIRDAFPNFTSSLVHGEMWMDTTNAVGIRQMGPDEWGLVGKVRTKLGGTRIDLAVSYSDNYDSLNTQQVVKLIKQLGGKITPQEFVNGWKQTYINIQPELF